MEIAVFPVISAAIFMLEVRVQLIQTIQDPFTSSFLWHDQHGRVIDREAVAQHRFDERANRLDVDPRREGFAEVDTAPAREVRLGAVHAGAEFLRAALVSGLGVGIELKSPSNEPARR